MANQLRQRYDVIINGGGIVGFTVLNLILKSPHLKRCKVLLLEQASKPKSLRQPPRALGGSSSSEWNQSNPDQPSEKSFSNRVSSLTEASKVGFKKLGVWEDIRSYSKDVKSIKVWNYNYPHRIVFSNPNSDAIDNKEEDDTMFSVVENNRLSTAILNNIYKQNTDVIVWDHTLQHLSQSSNNGLVEVVANNSSTGEELILEAPLILGCDGFKSKVRDFAGLKYTERDLNKTAVVGTVRMDPNYKQDANEVAYQRFSNDKDTVAALLPLDNEYSSFVISAPKEYSNYLLECDGDDFIQEFNRLLTVEEQSNDMVLNNIHHLTDAAVEGLQKIFSMMNTKSGLGTSGDEFEEPPRLDSVVQNSRASFPLFFGTTTPKMVAPLPGRSLSQIALLGDSSHRVHPLAGQGLNLGVQDAIELVRQIEAVVRSGDRVFDSVDHYSLDRALKRYEFKRQAYIVPMTAGILSMQSLFKLVPSSVVSAVNRCSPIKTASIKIANGC